MNGPLLPPGGGDADGADAQTMAAVRSARFPSPFRFWKPRLRPRAGLRRRSLDDGDKGGRKPR
jgi:hypothetical protein